MRQIFVVLFAAFGLVACGTSTGGGGGGVFTGVTPTDTVGGIMDVAADGDTAASADGIADAKPDVATDVLQPGSLKTCTEASQCAIDACKNGWSPTCGQTCANATGSAAAPSASALLDCTTKKCVQGKCATTPTQDCMDACTASDCPNELVTCWEQGATPGSKGCSTVLGCLSACDSNPERFTCKAACYNAADKAGETAFKALSACVAKNGGKTDPCAKESLTCISDGKTGSGTCYDVQDCVGKCAKTDTVCQGACYGNGSATAQTQLLTLLDCVNSKGASACLDQTVTCATPTGTTGCVDSATCVGGCPAGDTQATCVMSCLHNASPKAGKVIGPFLTCMQKNCATCSGSDCQNCAISKCFSQASTCNSN
jgi:hypothetical protein